MNTKKYLNTFLVLFSCLSISNPAFSETKKSEKKQEEKSKAPSSSTILNDSWYTMQAGSTPWGYFHEMIEKKKDQYFYRYEMVKNEKGQSYQENIGAIAQLDLTPVAFNLTKNGGSAIEIINGTYSKKENGTGSMHVDVQGARKDSFKRNIPKGTILEVFFPVYIAQEWAKLKPGYKSNIKVFTEDAASNEYTHKTAYYQVKGMDPKDGCMELDIEMENLKTNMCLMKSGALMKMNVNGSAAQIRRVASEKQAKAFLNETASPKQKEN